MLQHISEYLGIYGTIALIIIGYLIAIMFIGKSYTNRIGHYTVVTSGRFDSKTLNYSNPPKSDTKPMATETFKAGDVPVKKASGRYLS